MIDTAPLDNPIWHSLGGIAHRHLAIGHGLARRYPPDVSPLCAVQFTTTQAFRDLRALVSTGARAALFTLEPVEPPPGDWQTIVARPLDQMVWIGVPSPTPGPEQTVELREEDVPAMLALTAATEPGPFLPRTIDMGQYRGIRSPEGHLVAMAGERLKPDGFTEVSAVCTDPSFRGRGYARSAMVPVIANALAFRSTPFLHVMNENPARHLYASLGFAFRRSLQLTVLLAA